MKKINFFIIIFILLGSYPKGISQEKKVQAEKIHKNQKKIELVPQTGHMESQGRFTPYGSRGVHSTLLSPKGRFLATIGSYWSGEFKINVWCLATGKLFRSTWVLGSPVIAFSTDSKILAIGHYNPLKKRKSKPKEIIFWHMESGQKNIVKTPYTDIFSITFCPDGNTMATGVNQGLFFGI